MYVGALDSLDLRFWNQEFPHLFNVRRSYFKRAAEPQGGWQSGEQGTLEGLPQVLCSIKP